MSTNHEYRIRACEAKIAGRDSEIADLKSEIDRLKEIIEEVILTANSTYKKKKVLEEVDDFLSKRLNGRQRTTGNR